MAFNRPLLCPAVVTGSAINVDDFASVQAALNALGTGGNNILNFTSGATYNISSTLAISDKNGWQINGNGAKLFMTASFPLTAGNSGLEITNCDDIVIQDLTIDGNRAGQGLNGNTASAAAVAAFRIHECDRWSFVQCTALNAIREGFLIQGHDNHGTILARHPHDGLLLDCVVDNAMRNGMAIICGHNIQVRGGEYKNTRGQDPRAGIDIEPDDDTARGPPGDNEGSNSHILIQGVSFSGQQRGLSISGVARSNPPDGPLDTVNTFDVTVEGCDFSGGAVFIDPIQRGYGIHLAGKRILIKDNTFHDFGTIYNDLDACLVIPANSVWDTIEQTDNTFNNLTTTQPVHLVRGSSGVNHSIANARGHNCAGTFVTNSNPSGCTTSNNVSNSSGPYFVDPPTPHEVNLDHCGALTTDFDTFSETAAEFNADTTFQHTPVGTARGVTVLIIGRGSAADQVSGVTYGGVALTRYEFAADTATELGTAYAYHLGESIPTSVQTVAIDLVASPAGFFRAVCITTTTTRNTQVFDSGVVQENVANPSITLNTAQATIVYAALFSGATAAGVSPGADYTQLAEYESSGTRTMLFMRRTETASAGSVTANWTSATDDVAGVAIAVGSALPGINVEGGIYALTGTAATLVRDSEIVVAAGAYALSGSNAALAKVGNAVLLAEPSSYAIGGQTTALEMGRAVAASGGSYALSGSTAGLTVSAVKLLMAASGSYSLSGSVADLMTERLLQMDVSGGEYLLIGGDAFFIVPVSPVGYVLFSDEQMDDRLLPSGAGALDPGVVRSSLLTLRDRIAHLGAGAGGPSYINLTAEQMTALLMDNTNATVDSFILRSVILSLRDRITAAVDAPDAAVLGTYRIMTSEEMERFLWDSTHGYIDAYILRSAILTLRDWIRRLDDD